jgi:signal transduction histidine kinase
MDTFFAPAARTDKHKLEEQIETVSNNPLMNTLLKSVGGLLVVLNEDRQIVSLNHAVLDYLGIRDPEKVLGLRLGESLKCIHSEDLPNGCGTTAHCVTCGAAIAMMAALMVNRTDEQVCALTAENDGVVQDISLLVRAQPLVVENERWILIFAQDITQQQFWLNLERVFFHDINNILTVLMGRTEILALKMPENEHVLSIRSAVERLLNEMALQKTLSQKDTSDLETRRESSIFEIRKEIDFFLLGHPLADKKNVTMSWPEEDVSLYTNPSVITRVLVNMLVNALEAAQQEETVTLCVRVEPTRVIWDVWNKSFIPAELQKRIFQRHFSTKAKIGRGLGTYSMKLFGEKYLKGEVTFTSSPDEGTTFTFSLPRP